MTWERFEALGSRGGTLVVFDVNSAQLFNLSYGHRVLDELIPQIGAALAKAVHPAELLRVEGDKWAAWVDDAASAKPMLLAGCAAVWEMNVPFEYDGTMQASPSHHRGRLEVRGAWFCVEGPASLREQSDEALWLGSLPAPLLAPG